MARNRRNHAGGLRFAPLVKAVLLCLLIGGSGVGYVWQKEQIEQLGIKREAREKELDQLRRQNEQLTALLQKLRTVDALKAQIKVFNLGLEETDPRRIVRLNEPVAAPARSDTQYAASEKDVRTQ